jgi:hypothetical protein
VEDRAQIRRLHKTEGLPIKMIARTLAVSRNTARAALASEGPPTYVRRPQGRRSMRSSHESVSGQSLILDRRDALSFAASVVHVATRGSDALDRIHEELGT